MYGLTRQYFCLGLVIHFSMRGMSELMLSTGPSVSYKSIVNILGTIIFAIPLLYLIFEKSWPLISRSWENLETWPKPAVCREFLYSNH